MLTKDNRRKIVELFFSENLEDKELAKNWLSSEIGIENASATFVLLLFYRDWESDNGEKLDDDNYFKMKFDTYSSGYGNNYRYEVKFISKVNGRDYKTLDTYSRHEVGGGQPKFEFMQWLDQVLKNDGINVDNEIFLQDVLQAIPVVQEEFA